METRKSWIFYQLLWSLIKAHSSCFHGPSGNGVQTQGQGSTLMWCRAVLREFYALCSWTRGPGLRAWNRGGVQESERLGNLSGIIEQIPKSTILLGATHFQLLRSSTCEELSLRHLRARAWYLSMGNLICAMWLTVLLYLCLMLLTRDSNVVSLDPLSLPLNFFLVVEPKKKIIRVT